MFATQNKAIKFEQTSLDVDGNYEGKSTSQQWESIGAKLSLDNTDTG